MRANSEPSVLFETKEMFSKSRNCKIFQLNDKNQSGDLFHSHDYMQIWYVTKGMCQHWVEGEEHIMVRGEAFIFPPTIVHKTVICKNSEIICCEFSLDNFLMTKENSHFSIIKEQLLDLSFMLVFMPGQQQIKPKFALSPEAQNRVEKLMFSMLDEYTNNAVYFEQFLRVQILELLLIFAREYSFSPNQNEASAIFDKYKLAVEAAIEYINLHYNEQITLEDICKFSLVSKTYFCYLFKVLTQQTFIEYLMNIRIKKAMELLENIENSITNISYEVGFNDLTHFSRTFKKMVGISPRTYRTLKQRDLSKGK